MHIAEEELAAEQPPFDPVKDELPYIALLNRVLPPDIRILAWCPHPPSNFDARFSCKERKYRYFFTTPAFLPLPGPAGLSARTRQREGWLDIAAMEKAASYLVGTHDFRNFCKVDPTKQLTSFARRITDARVGMVSRMPSPNFVAGPSVTDTVLDDVGNMTPVSTQGKIYSFDVQGSAFLWHQVRCMVAVLFLVGQGLEKPEIVRELLDVAANPRKPHYEMASDQPLVLWECMFSVDPEKGKFGDGEKPQRYIDRGTGVDELEWIYAADSGPGASNQAKWGPMGLMPDLWRGWRKAKMDEVLAAQLLDMVALQGNTDVSGHEPLLELAKPERENQRVFEGYDNAMPRGKYVPIMQRPRMDPVDIINARWAAKKGRPPRVALSGDNGNE
jgi:tRNA pseudouridine38/39 synthase